MKKTVAFILLLAFAMDTFSRAIIFVDFYLNQSYLAAKKCENRYRPMLHCNGNCILAKKLRQQEKEDQKNPERKIENKNEVISSRSFFVSYTDIVPINYPEHNIYLIKRTVDRSFSVFHPPCA
jgi:hypothetical protein